MQSLHDCCCSKQLAIAGGGEQNTGKQTAGICFSVSSNALHTECID